MAANTQTQLMNSIESVSDGFALFDAEGRLVLCNSTWKNEINAAVSGMIEPGVKFIDILRRNLEIGTILEAVS